jgi:hypothetical protein
VLFDLEECDISSTGERGVGGSINPEGGGGSWPREGLEPAESFDLREPVGV